MPAARHTNITACPDAATCLTLADRIESHNQTVSEDQAWALIHQSVLMFRGAIEHSSSSSSNSAGGGGAAAGFSLAVPRTMHELCLHRDGSVHIAAAAQDRATTEQQVLLHLGFVVCQVLNAPGGRCAAEGGGVSPELDETIRIMMLEEEDGDEELSADDVAKQTLAGVLAMCEERADAVGERAGESRAHYRAVCRALVMESLDLREFLRIVCKVGVDEYC